MSRTISDPRHKVLREFLTAKRKQSGLRQVDVATKLRRSQDYVSHVETGQKIVDLIEFTDWATVCGFSPAEVFPLLRPARNGNKNASKRGR